jgi:hypothetical protein
MELLVSRITRDNGFPAIGLKIDALRLWRFIGRKPEFPNNFGNSGVRLGSLEIQADGSFKEASLITFVLDRSERRVPVDIEERTRRRRVVEDVGGVHSDLQLLRFGNPDRLAH